MRAKQIILNLLEAEGKNWDKIKYFAFVHYDLATSPGYYAGNWDEDAPEAKLAIPTAPKDMETDFAGESESVYEFIVPCYEVTENEFMAKIAELANSEENYPDVDSARIASWWKEPSSIPNIFSERLWHEAYNGSFGKAGGDGTTLITVYVDEDGSVDLQTPNHMVKEVICHEFPWEYTKPLAPEPELPIKEEERLGLTIFDTAVEVQITRVVKDTQPSGHNFAVEFATPENPNLYPTIWINADKFLNYFNYQTKTGQPTYENWEFKVGSGRCTGKESTEGVVQMIFSTRAQRGEFEELTGQQTPRNFEVGAEYIWFDKAGF